MIIDAKTVTITIIIISVAFYAGLQVIRRFALTIAQENHDANMAEDQAEEVKRLKKERDADAAASAAFAKVEPLLAAVTTTTVAGVGVGAGSAPSSGAVAPAASAPSSGTGGPMQLEMEQP